MDTRRRNDAKAYLKVRGKRKGLQITDIKSLPKARGKRLKALRMLADLSRKDVQANHGISASTIQSWEDGKAGGLTEKGAQRILTALRKVGVQCSIDWLLYGIGAGPQVSDKIYTSLSDEHEEIALDVTIPMDEESGLIKELLTFRQSNSDAIDTTVSDDGMEPYFCCGDYVGGKRRYDKDIISTLGLDCIIETTMGETLLRRIRQGTQEGLYTLLCINPNTTVEKPALYDIEVFSAAPVIWHRRKDPSTKA